jgi:magnesium and cobalt transporter
MSSSYSTSQALASASSAEHGASSGADSSSAADPLSRSSQSTSQRPRSSLLGWVKSALGLRGRESTLREALEEVLEEHEEGTINLNPEEKTLLQNVLHFGETTVSEIMVPLPDILAVPDDAPFEDIKNIVLESRHTRIPVYHETIDQIRGFLHAKDLIQVMTSAATFEIGQVLRQLLYIPPSMRIMELLVEMKRSRVHMAIVIDEFGGTHGLITLEDLFEELVGDIQDEHDTEEDAQQRPEFDANGVLEVDAKLRIDEMDEEDAISLRPEEEDEEFETLAGLAVYHFGRVPEVGDSVTLPAGWKIDILEADERRVLRVRLHRPQPLTESESE